MAKRSPRTLSSGANNTVIALNETEVGKLFTGDTRSDIGSEAEKMKFANEVNGLIVKFYIFCKIYVFFAFEIVTCDYFKCKKKDIILKKANVYIFKPAVPTILSHSLCIDHFLLGSNESNGKIVRISN